jgi:hypothetical protein
MTDFDNSVMDDAEQVVLAFINKHRQAAIPAIIGYCTMWMVDNGALNLIKSTLSRCILAADDMESIRRDSAQ